MKERKGSSATDEYEPWSLDLGHSSDCQSKAPLSLAISFLLATQTTGRTESRSATKEGRRRSLEALRASYGSLSEDSDDDSSLERSKKQAAVSPPSPEPQLLTSWIRQCADPRERQLYDDCRTPLYQENRGGRFSDGWGSCEHGEKKFMKPNHDIPSTAKTRAKNKACQLVV